MSQHLPFIIFIISYLIALCYLLCWIQSNYQIEITIYKLNKKEINAVPYITASNIQDLGRNISELTIESQHNQFSENDLEFNFDFNYTITKLGLSILNLYALPYFASDNHQKHTFKELAQHFITDHGGSGFQPKLVTCGQIIWVKADYIDMFFAQFHPMIASPYILITHVSVYGVGKPGQLKYLDDNKIIMWFGQNIIAKHPKLRPLPMLSNINDTRRNKLSRNLKPFDQRKTLMYVNIRSKTLSYFKNNFGNDSNVIIIEKPHSWEEYIMQMADTQFVISPPGNGKDYYRIWEALVMGAVPIVLRSELQPLYDEMPVMVVNDWNEVTKESLKEFQTTGLPNISSNVKIPWRQKIWLRYWIDQIDSVRTDYIKNHC